MTNATDTADPAGAVLSLTFALLLAFGVGLLVVAKPKPTEVRS